MYYKETLKGLKNSWKGLELQDKISLLTMVLPVVALPFFVFVAVGPLKLFSRASYPATPPVTSPITGTPIPTVNPMKNPVNFITDQVYLKADHFYIKVNGIYYYDNTADIAVHSDPGNSTYTTLEATWHENGVEMRLYMYFRADAANWWMYEMRTYNGKNPGDWIYYYNPVKSTPLGQPFYGNYGWIADSTVYPNSGVYFTGLVLLPFRYGKTPSVTPFYTPTPTRSITPTITPSPTTKPIPTLTNTPTPYGPTPTFTPTPTPDPANHAPQITSRSLKTGFVGRKYKTILKAVDTDGDRLMMLVNYLPKNLTKTDCSAQLVSGRTELMCFIEGVPIESGVFSPQIIVVDEKGLYDVENLSLIIFLLPKFLQE